MNVSNVIRANASKYIESALCRVLQGNRLKPLPAEEMIKEAPEHKDLDHKTDFQISRLEKK